MQADQQTQPSLEERYRNQINSTAKKREEERQAQAEKEKKLLCELNECRDQLADLKKNFKLPDAPERSQVATLLQRLTIETIQSQMRTARNDSFTDSEKNAATKVLLENLKSRMACLATGNKEKLVEEKDKFSITLDKFFNTSEGYETAFLIGLVSFFMSAILTLAMLTPNPEDAKTCRASEPSVFIQALFFTLTPPAVAQFYYNATYYSTYDTLTSLDKLLDKIAEQTKPTPPESHLLKGTVFASATGDEEKLTAEHDEQHAKGSRHDLK